VPRRRLRVLVLTHKELYARASIEGLSEREVVPWRTEYHVVRGLRAMGHDVRQLGLDDSLLPLHSEIDRSPPDIVFNLLVELRDSGGYEPHVVAALEARGVPFTGCNSEGLTLTRDKAITKKLLGWHRIPVPEFATFRRGRSLRRPRALEFPLIVKPVDEGGSDGIAAGSVVRSWPQLERRVAIIHDRFRTGAIVERYIDGRELTVGVLGNRRLQSLPIWETFFDGLPKRAPRISTSRLKWNLEHRRSLGVRSGYARRLSASERARIARLAKRAYRILRLSGFARIDFRLAPDGRPFVIDVNPNPDIDFLEDFARSARAAGIRPHALLQRLLNLGLRYRPYWAD